MAIITKALATASGQNDIVFALRNMAEVITGGNTIESIYNTMMNKYGYPFTASTVSAMTDQSKIYVYTGSETGYTAGNWYYYNGSAWVSGGVFNSQALSTDTSLTVSGAAADAKATGDAITSTRAEMSLFGVDDLFWDNVGTPTISSQGITYTVDTVNRQITVSGTATSTSYCRFYYSTSSIPAWLSKGKTYIAHMHTTTGALFYISWYDSGETAHVLVSTNSQQSFVIPSSAIGLMIRVYVPTGGVANGILHPFISESPSIPEIQKSINDITFESLSTRGAIANNTDIDSVTDAGIYTISSGNTYANLPYDNASLGGILIVLKPTSTIVSQIIYTNDGKHYYRRAISGVYNSWVRTDDFVADGVVPDTTDLNNVVNSGFSFILGSNTYVNNPLDSGVSGVLTTYVTGGYITQIIHAVSQPLLYVRRKSGSWFPWQEISGKKKNLKILQIGSSFGQDQCTYAPFILQNFAPDVGVTFGIAYKSGATFDDYIDRFDNDTADIQYSICRPTSSAWTIQANKTLKYILTAQDWDIIMFNQGMGYQEVWSSYANFGAYIDRIINYIATDNGAYVGHSVKLGYIFPQVNALTETADSYNNLISCVQNLDSMYPLQFIIPCGTAVQNARGTTLDQYGAGGHMTYDGKHLQEGIGCMVGAYTVALKVLELACVNNISILGEDTRPDTAWVTDHNIPGKNWDGSTVVGITNENCLIAQKCAIMAIKKPYEVSTIV